MIKKTIFRHKRDRNRCIEKRRDRNKKYMNNVAKREKYKIKRY